MKNKLIPTLTLLLCLYGQAVAQVGFGNAGQDFADEVTSLTLSSFSVPAGTNRLLVVHFQGSNVPNDITFGGAAMSVHVADKFWYLVLGDDNVATVGDVSLTFPAATTGALFALSFAGVSQSAPLGTVQSQNVTSGTNTHTVASQSNDLVIDIISAFNGGPGCSVPALTVGSGQTVRIEETATLPGLGGVCGHVAASTEPGAPSVDMSWDTDGGNGDHYAFNINHVVLPNNVGIGTTTPDASAALDIHSDHQGILVPRLTTSQRMGIDSPAQGLVVYDSDLKAFFFHNGTMWTQIIYGSNDDADSDPSNELITSATLNGTNLEITDAGGTTTVDLGSLAGSESTTVSDGNTVDLTLTGTDITAETILDPAGDNILTSSASGLKATEDDPEVGSNTTNYLPKWDGSALVQSTSVFEDGSGNVGIGTATPNPSAALDIQSTGKGLLIPRMTNAQIAAIATPATGLQVYSLDDGCIHLYDGAKWTMDCALEFNAGTLPPVEEWTQLTDFPANFNGRFGAVSFVVGGEAYVGTGNNNGTYKKDLWKYNPATDSWTQLNDFPTNFDARFRAVSFVVGGGGLCRNGRQWQHL